jgi:hypothetical protein
MQEKPSVQALANAQALLKRKLLAREKILNHLESRLMHTPEDAHCLFLKTEHEQAQESLKAEMRALEAQKNQPHALSQWVNDYLNQWETEDDVFSSEEASPQTRLEPALQHELETWQSLLRKVEERLLRLPGDPRLLTLRESHRQRIQALQSGQKSEPDTPLSPSEAPSVQLETASPEPTGRTLAQIEKEILIWHKLVEKSKARLAAKPELTHLKTMIAEHQNKIEQLETEWAERENKPEQ